MANGKGSEDCLLCQFVDTSGGLVRCVRHGLTLPRPGCEVVCADYQSGKTGLPLTGTRFVGLREGTLYYYSYAVSSHCDILADFGELRDCSIVGAKLRNDVSTLVSSAAWTIEVSPEVPVDEELSFEFDGKICIGTRHYVQGVTLYRKRLADDIYEYQETERNRCVYVLDTPELLSHWIEDNYNARNIESTFAKDRMLANHGIPVFVRVYKGQHPPRVTLTKDVLAARNLF